MGVSPIQESHRIESNDATHRIQFMRSRTQYGADDDSLTRFRELNRRHVARSRQ